MCVSVYVVCFGVDARGKGPVSVFVLVCAIGFMWRWTVVLLCCGSFGNGLCLFSFVLLCSALPVRWANRTL